MSEMLDVVYSDEYNAGDYYMWADENPNQENRDGFFVTTILNEQGQLCIKICGEEDDIFGVTVDSAAFVGGQAEIERDYRYGLVVPIGVVPVRCEMEVAVGDYVTVNKDGVAKQASGSFGYRVVALNDITHVTFATIILSTQGDKLSDIYDELCVIDKQINTMEENITGAMNTANVANNKIDALQKDLGDLSDKVGNVSGTLDGVQNNINDLWGASTSTNTSVEQLRTDLQTQITEASTRAEEAATNANEALGDVSALIKDVEPLTTWTNGQESGATYLVEYINNGVATKAEVETASNNARNALTSVEKNALGIQSLASSISIYSVGEFSQAHGFSIDDAIATMEKGMVYVPTVDHSETYVRDVLSVVDRQDEIDSSGALDGGSLEDRLVRGIITAAPVQAYDIVDYTMEFTKGYYYVWNGERWDESDSVSVFFSETYITGNDNAPFWYTCDVSVTHPENGIVYAAETLHLWQDDRWVAVATTKHNATAKMISRVNQTTDAFSIELVNARGSTASLDVRLDDNESKISLLTQWQGTASDTMAGLEIKSDEQEAKINQFTTWQSETSNKITSIEQISNEQEAKISLVVQSQDGENSINSAGIIMAVNEDSSDLKIAAGKIQLSGITEFVRPGDLSTSGKTVINGDNITTGIIKGPGDNTSSWNLQTGELKVVGMPTKVSDLENDSGFQTASGVTSIVGGVVTTDYINALGITVDAANVKGTLTIGQLPDDVATKGDIPSLDDYATSDELAQKLGTDDFETFQDNLANGDTEIHGGCIKTGTLIAEQIIAPLTESGQSELKISADYLTLDGCVTFGDLDGYATINDIPSVDGLLDEARFNAYIDAIENGTTTINGGCITTGIIQGSAGGSYWNLNTGELVVAGMPTKVSDLENDSGYATTDEIPSVDGLLDADEFQKYQQAIANGSTTIHGGCITTGVIAADYLDLAGCLTVGDLSGYATEEGLSTGTTTISGGCITTGMITDQTGTNSWNLIDGIFTTTVGYIGDFAISTEGLLYTDGENQVEINSNYGFRVVSDTPYGIGKFTVGTSSDGGYFDWYVNNGKGQGLTLTSMDARLMGTWLYKSSEIATLADLVSINARLAALEAGNSGGDTTCTHEGTMVYTSHGDSTYHTVSCGACNEVIDEYEACSNFDDGMGFCSRCGQSLM